MLARDVGFVVGDGDDDQFREEVSEGKKWRRRRKKRTG